jgi:hypothetical protein
MKWKKQQIRNNKSIKLIELLGLALEALAF